MWNFCFYLYRFFNFRLLFFRFLEEIFSLIPKSFIRIENFWSFNQDFLFQSDVDPFMCTCGPCRKFWKDNFNDASDLLRESSSSRAQNTAPLSCKNSIVKVGDRVEVHGKYPGKGWSHIFHVCFNYLTYLSYKQVVK